MIASVEIQHYQLQKCCTLSDDRLREARRMVTTSLARPDVREWWSSIFSSNSSSSSCVSDMLYNTSVLYVFVSHLESYRDIIERMYHSTCWGLNRREKDKNLQGVEMRTEKTYPVRKEDVEPPSSPRQWQLCGKEEQLCLSVLRFLMFPSLFRSILLAGPWFIRSKFLHFIALDF